jgi:hypothetical protein
MSVVTKQSKVTYATVSIAAQTFADKLLSVGISNSSETWTLTAKDENLRIFEMQILRKIFGPVNIDNVWRIQNNMEIDNLIVGADIVGFIKARRIR